MLNVLINCKVLIFLTLSQFLNKVHKFVKAGTGHKIGNVFLCISPQFFKISYKLNTWDSYFIILGTAYLDSMIYSIGSGLLSFWTLSTNDVCPQTQ